jgi:hypothetical protein
MNPYVHLLTEPIQRLRDSEIIEAARHHLRALASLQGITFECLSAPTKQKLILDLAEGLHLLERELERRGVAALEIESTGTYPCHTHETKTTAAKAT